MGKGQAKNGGDDGSGTPFISAFYFSLLFPAHYSGPLFPALYFSLLTRVRDKDCVKNRVKRAKIVRFTLC